MQRRQKGAFRKLYEMHVKQMLHVSYRILSDYSHAEDAVQEAFITCYERIDDLNEPKAFSSWLKRIVVNKSLNKLRTKDFVYDEIETLDVVEEIEDNTWYEGVSMKRIREKILELPAKSRVIFTLKAFEGLTHTEIAEELDIHLSTSKSQYIYALQLLKTSLQKYREYEI